MKKAKEFLKNIISNLVSLPEDIEIQAIEDERGVLLKVWVNKADMGMIIGRGGTNASAIKLLMKLYGYKHDLKIAIKIEEPKNDN